MNSISKTEVKCLLPLYLELEHSINTRHLFRCLNPQHEDNHPSMGYNSKNQTVHCFACSATYDIFDLVGLDHPSVNPRDRFIRTFQLYYEYKRKGII